MGMTTTFAIRLSLAATLLTAACGSSTDAPSSTGLHAEVTDPVGDVAPTAGVPHPPDLIHGTVDVTDGIATFTLQFAPGTLDRQAVSITIDIDADQSKTTGEPALLGGGIDYQIGKSAGTGLGFVTRYSPTTCPVGGPCFPSIGQAAFSFGTDTFTISVPLATLGNSSGHMNYVAFVSVADTLPGGGLTAVGDAMPDISLPPAHVP
jgi:hypothetical protein